MTLARIQSWFALWDDLLKEPHRVLLDPDAIDVAAAALEALRPPTTPAVVQRSERTARARLLARLKALVEADAPTLALLRRVDSDAFNALSTEIRKGSWDASLLRSILERVTAALPVSTLSSTIAELLSLAGTAANTGQPTLIAATRRLIKRNLEVHEASTLPRSAEDAGATALIRATLRPQAAALRAAGRAALRIPVTIAFRAAVLPSGHVAARATPAPASGDEFLARTDATRRLQSALASMLPSDGNYATVSPDRSACIAVAEDLARELVPDVLRFLLARGDYSPRRDTSTVFDAAGAIIVDELLQRGVLTRRPHPSQRPRDLLLDSAASRALSEAALGSAVRATSDACPASVWRSGVSPIAVLLDSALQEASSAAHASSSWSLQEWSARKATQARIADALGPLRTALESLLGQLASGTSLLPALEEALLPDMSCWADRFAAIVGSSRGALAYLHSSAVSSAAEVAVTAVADGLAARSSNWMVLFRVRHLNPEHRLFRLGRVTFYDAADYAFGESRYAFSDEPSATPTAGAMVEVSADSGTLAYLQARERLEEALAALTVAFSANRSIGFRPEVDSWRQFRNLTTNAAGMAWDTPVSQMHDVHGAVTHDVEGVAQDLCKLYDRVAAQPDTLSALQRESLISLHWYRKARWLEDTTARYVASWISAEHLFARNRHDQPDFDRMARLSVTWRDLPSTRQLRFLLSVMREELLKPECAALADACDALAGWRDDVTILISAAHLRALPKDAAMQPTGFQNAAEALADELERLPAETVVRALEAARTQRRFVLQRLYDLRNRIVHEGLHAGPVLSLYLRMLDEIVEDIHQKLFNHSVAIAGALTVDDAIAWYERPFTP